MQQKSRKSKKLKNDRKRTQNIIIKMLRKTNIKTPTSSTSRKTRSKQNINKIKALFSSSEDVKENILKLIRFKEEEQKINHSS